MTGHRASLRRRSAARVARARRGHLYHRLTTRWTYLVRHPNTSRRGRVSVIDPSNPWVLAPHAPQPPKYRSRRPISLHGPELRCHSATRRRYLKRRARRRFFWDATQPRAPQRPPTCAAPPETSIVDAATGTVIGTIDQGFRRRPRLPGAIYIHQGAHLPRPLSTPSPRHRNPPSQGWPRALLPEAGGGTRGSGHPGAGSGGGPGLVDHHPARVGR